MKTYFYTLAGLFLLSACGSDSADGNYNRVADEELIEEQVDASTQHTIDSIARNAEEGNIMHPIPDTLARLLLQRQPSAKAAPLTDQTIANRRLQVDNPVYIRGNFNSNNTPDYAVQVLQNDSVYILAFMDYTQNAKELKVATYPATKLADGIYSTYQLKLAPQDSVVRNPRRQQTTSLKTDGISVIEGDRTTLYVLQNNRFIPFDAQE